ncbi:cytochrome bd-I oxidase subunit CydX [Roseateles aquatilis]|uniref:Cytochrome bd-I oxidase subunit CydX n=1 Tax=Roseateles aquatilis TaxID=431061 RepID=A0A246JDP5_9BURK|nr:cytochrome bd-I oxidase subunit CydX [Roseateles aquatilis]OWQ90701.1 cytochrome bd-I oxidase subunit CydX [Roseateles aquatilis]
MWYFAWLLGLPLAAGFAVLNAMWFELMDDEAHKRAPPPLSDPGARHPR